MVEAPINALVATSEAPGSNALGRESLRQCPRLLGFGINYAPEPTGTALNSTGYTQGLAQRGWHVTMITGIPHYPSWRAGLAPWRSTEGGVEVIRRRHFVPATQSTTKRGAYEASWVAAALPLLVRPRKVDLVLGVVPSLGGAVLAAAAARRYGVPYALLFQDLIGKAAVQSGIAGAGRIASAIEALEKSVARGAQRVAIVADGFRNYFVCAGIDDDRIVRLRNPARLGSAQESREATRQRLGWGNRFVAIHTGSMGYKQGLDNVLAAAGLARDRPEFLFVFQGDGNQRAKLEADAQHLRLKNVSFRPVAPEKELASILCAADVGLLNQRASVHNMSLPAKLASYFAAGLPVIAAVAAGDETARELELAQAGVAVEPDQPGALLAALDKLKSNPERAATLGRAGAAYAERFLTLASAVATFDEFLQSCLPDLATA